MKNNNSTPEIEKKYKKLLERGERAEKRKHAPKGGTMARQIEKERSSKFYLRSKQKPRIKLIDGIKG